MKHFPTLLLLTLFCFVSTIAAEAPEKHSFVHDGVARTYAMYIPDNLPKQAPLVVYTHGYGSKTRWLADLNAVADSAGFAVCYPDGLPDAKGKDGWKVGYPPQETLTVDEASFFKSLLDHVCDKYSLSRQNVFLTGMSNGGDLCYQLAYTAPELFKAYASVAGLTFEYAYLPNKLTLSVPFLEIHGTADKTSMWQGDHQNTGGWGPYIPVPLAVAAIAANNKCATEITDTVPSLPESGKTVVRTLYTDSPAGHDVVLYRIEGGKHSWAKKDIETSKIIWDFFAPYVK